MSNPKFKKFSNSVVCPYDPDAFLIEDYHAGDMICSMCGLVVGDRVIDVSSEWRTFADSDKDSSRVGAAENPLLQSNNLSTLIVPGKGSPDDFSGRYHNRSNVSSADRILLNGFKTISEMCDRLNLPKSISDPANMLYKKVKNGKILRGRSNEAISSACLYIACRQEGVPRTFKEIVATSTVGKKEIARCFKLILNGEIVSKLDVTTSDDYMNRFCSNLGLERKIQSVSRRIAERAFDLDLVPGRVPISVAAAAIYMASQTSIDKKSLREISEITGVAESTIKNSYRQMRQRATELFPENFSGSFYATSIEQLPHH